MVAKIHVLSAGGSDRLIRLSNLENKAAGGGVVSDADPMAVVRDGDGATVTTASLVNVGAGLYEGIISGSVGLVHGDRYTIEVTITSPYKRFWRLEAMALDDSS